MEATLNGLKITVDKQTGSIVAMEYPGPGKLLDAKPERAGILDLAYPIPEFEPLRLASRYSRGARVESSKDSIVISWDNLGASRPYFKAAGKIFATVWITAMPDERSISMKCELENESERSIGQILFPDLHGLLTVGGKEGTYLRSAGFVRRPFLDVGITHYPEFYALDDAEFPTDTRDTYAYVGGKSLGRGDSMIGRWLDYGGLNGGISVFPNLWSGDAPTMVRIFRLEKDPNVRLAHVHDLAIKPGEPWQSPEYVFTPHKQGWARGIEPYKSFVNSKINRAVPVPQHVRKGLGFRTIFMTTRYPADGESGVLFKATDLPAVAKESKEHGLDELLIWHWRPDFELPGPSPYPNLGTSEDFARAIQECNKLGVNVSLFVSVITLSEQTASRYGLKPGVEPGWTYHPELIPRYNPPYALSMATVGTNIGDPNWRKDVLADVKNIQKQYTHSISWDQAYSGTEGLFQEFRSWVKTNPEATLAGEASSNLERMTDYLDYTWNWESGSYHHNLNRSYRDVRAFNAAFPSPRLNYNINRNGHDVKYAFMDNCYVNVMPSAPDSVNGSAYIKDYPDVGHVLKQCASLRTQFLPYFVDGKLIGECLLKEPNPAAHINAYVLPDKVLFIVMNLRNDARPVSFHVDLEPWLSSKTGKYEVKSYDQYGQVRDSGKEIAAEWQSETLKMERMEFAIFEFISN